MRQTDHIVYASLCILPSGRSAIVLGNCIKADGTVWVADYETGEMSRPVASALRYTQTRPEDVFRRCVRWAVDGNPDAMWWLGDVHEYGSRELIVGRDNLRALGYFVGAIRHDPRGFSGNAHRVFTDLTTKDWIIRADAPDNAEPNIRARRIVRAFPEIRQFYKRVPYTWGDWRSAMAFMGLPPHATPQLGSFAHPSTKVIHRWSNRHGLDWWMTCKIQPPHPRRALLSEAEGVRRCAHCFPAALTEGATFQR